MRLPVAQVLAACLRSARFQRFQQYLQGAGHVRPADLRKIVQHRRCCGRIGDQPFAQLRRIPRYAIARPAVCPDCTPPAASMELGETADPPAVSAAVWAGMAAVRGASAVHGVRDSAHPDASRDASVACVFLGFRAVCGIRLLCRHLSCRRASRAAPYACYALRSYSSLLPSIARM